jgi:hypothetical protein
MYEPSYYREQAERARRMGWRTIDREISDLLDTVALDYDEIAEDLERGAIDIRHPELMPQSEHAPSER